MREGGTPNVILEGVPIESGRLKNLRVVGNGLDPHPALRRLAEFILSEVNVLQGDKGAVLFQQCPLLREGAALLAMGFDGCKNLG